MRERPLRTAYRPCFENSQNAQWTGGGVAAV